MNTHNRNILRDFFNAGIVILLCSPMLAGCVPRFSTNGYIHPSYSYEVEYSPLSRHSFISDEWRIVNYNANPQGAMVRRKTSKDYGPIFITEEPEGRIRTKEGYFTDLFLKNESTKSSIWISTRELFGEFSKKTLTDFAQNYADSLSERKAPIWGNVYGERLLG